MTRSDCVKEIMGQLSSNDIVVSSTGLISREVYRYDRDLNFYMQGSMGNALAIGIGLAMHLENRVFVIDGDGSALMGLGAMITAKSLYLKNLFHFILDNNCHESTGGQGTSSLYVDFTKINRNTIVYKVCKDTEIPPRINIRPEVITKRFKNAIDSICNKRI